MLWTERWDTGRWTALHNNTDDLYDRNMNVFAHPVEDPFAWYSNGSFHLLMHGFRMGMVNGTSQSTGGPRKGNAFGVYATAPTAFGPWRFQEARVAYTNVLTFVDGTPSLQLDRRERPHLLLGDDGQPTHLYNGVCPRGSSYNGPAAPGAGHCFTAVQPIAA